MTDNTPPELSALDQDPVSQPTPTNLAEYYAAGLPMEDPDVKYTEEEYEVEYSVRTCGHTGNCPCAVDEHTTTVTIRTYEADGSVYCEQLDRGFASYEAMEAAVGEDAAQNLDGLGF